MLAIRARANMTRDPLLARLKSRGGLDFVQVELLRLDDDYGLARWYGKEKKSG